MTASASRSSRKLASGPSTWRRRPNARRSRQLGRETHPTDGSNIFRWYRDTWGHYTQADPIGQALEVGLYAYVGDNPASAFDRMGLTPAMPTYHPPKGCTAGAWKMTSSEQFDNGTYYEWTLLKGIPPTQGIGPTLPGIYSHFVFGFVPSPTTNITSVSAGTCDCVYVPSGLYRHYNEVAKWRRKLKCGSECTFSGEESATTWSYNQKQWLPSIHAPYWKKVTTAPYNAGTNRCLCPGTYSE